MQMHDRLQEALTAIELREAELLSWGAVGAEWRADELLGLLDAYGQGKDLLGQLTELGLIVGTPSGGYRSRAAETLRLLATMRQAFRNEPVLSGRPLVLDFRFLQRPRRRPRRDRPAASIESVAVRYLGDKGLAALRCLVPTTVSAFQQRSSEKVFQALALSRSSGLVVTAGTGSGKTLAFYMPMLAWICDQTGQPPGVLALALYPRNELLRDQLRTLVTYALKLRSLGQGSAPVSLATWFGKTPRSAKSVIDGHVDGWRKVAGGYECPLLECPNADCTGGTLIWPLAQLRDNNELLRCTACATEIPGEVLRLTRDAARANPARVMLTTTESLNRQLASPGNLAAFGLNPGTIGAVLLDEVHTYEGTSGAQNAYLLRRLKHALHRGVVWAGLSATLADASGFFSRLVRLEAGDVAVVEPDPTELEESGAEYLVALRHNPHGNTGTLSTTIQTAMLLSRCLDPLSANPFSPSIDSRGIFGSRMFAFTDKLDSTNRLYWDLLDAEGWAWPGKARSNTRPLTLAHLRSEHQTSLPDGQRQNHLMRDAVGQYWWLGNKLGHELDGDVQKRIGRTSSQDSGVERDADIVVATASLEVGFDDDRVGAVLQHKAPHDAAQFLQRKGRAGRNPVNRPWTVVVLSDWGRDRSAWDSYDALFSPVVPPRSLPLKNVYVLKMQAVYCLLDWLAKELDYGDQSTWVDSAGPADMLGGRISATEGRQRRMAELLSSLLREGPRRDSMKRHLRLSLDLGTDSAADLTLEKILWDSPRPLLGAVVPTLRRRLADQWAGERPDSDDSGIRLRTPLRDFVPGNLFDDLLVPEVEFNVPWKGGESQIEQLPALRAIREFLPGNVSRHFGVWASNKRHWIPLPADIDQDGVHLVDVSLYGGTLIESIDTDDGDLPVFSPTHVDLATVPVEMSDASSMRASWRLLATPMGAGTSLSRIVSASECFLELRAHLHSQGGGLRVLRFTESGDGVQWSNGQSSPKRFRFTSRGREVGDRSALGIEIFVDAFIGKVHVPELTEGPSPSERTEWMRHLVQAEEGFPDAMSAFDRTSLADAAESFATKWDWATGDPDLQAFAQALYQEATILGLIEPVNPNSLANWLSDTDILETVRGHLVGARAFDRSTEWVEWLEKRFTLAAAQTLVAALVQGNGDIDSDDLLVDLDPQDRTTFYISEQSPGGTGQIEALTINLINSPERFSAAFEDALRPTDAERLDSQLRGLIQSGETAVQNAIADLSRTWPNGHEAMRRASEVLDQAVAQAGLVLTRTARIALTTRIAGPGAAPQFPSEIRHWLETRDMAEERSGFVVEPRSLASLLADRTAADAYLHLTSPSQAERVRAIANVLWPWGRSARATRSFNPYSSGLDPATDLLRLCCLEPLEALELGTWDDESRDAVHVRLRERGEIVLRARTGQRRLLRHALIDLQATPIELGPLLCHPDVVGVHDRGDSVEARIRLQETW